MTTVIIKGHTYFAIILEFDTLLFFIWVCPL
nr:MAG TPA: hypothetical protein [Bacteriophage sp.]